MALSKTFRGGAKSTSGTPPYVSFTPTDGSLLVIVGGGIYTSDTNPTAEVSAAFGGGLTWTKRKTTYQFADGWTSWIEVWTAPVVTGTSSAYGLDPSGTSDGKWCAVYEFTGADNSAPVGASVTATDSGTRSGSRTVTLDSAPASSSYIIGGVTVDNYSDSTPSTVIVEGTGWTEDFIQNDFGSAGPETYCQVESKTGTTSTSVLWNGIRLGISASYAAVEIVEGGGVTPVTASGGVSSVVPALSGTGTVGPTPVTASGGVSAPVPAISGAGTITIEASGGVTSSVPTLAGTGLGGSIGDGAISGTVPTLSGSGTVQITAYGGVASTVPTLDGSGSVAGNIAASGGVNSTVPTLGGSGSVNIASSGGVSSTVPTLSGDSTVSIAASGGVTGTVSTLDGSGTVQIAASGGVDGTIPTLAGEGLAGSIGDGAIDSTVPTISGAGIVQITASGGVNSTVPTLDGSGSTDTSVTATGAISAPVPVISGDATAIGGAAESEINPTGIGAVIDVRKRDKADKQGEQDRFDWERKRREIIEAAFEKVFGEPKPAPGQQVTKTQKKKIARIARTEMKTDGLEIRLAQAERLVEQYVAAVRKKRRDDEALTILLMAA